MLQLLLISNNSFFCVNENGYLEVSKTPLMACYMFLLIETRFCAIIILWQNR